MKCPQLSKPEATAARNQNSFGDRMEKKTLGETRLSRGAISPLARRHSSSIPTAAKSDGLIVNYSNDMLKRHLGDLALTSERGILHNTAE